MLNNYDTIVLGVKCKTKQNKLKNKTIMAQNTRNYNSLNFLRSVEKYEVTGRSLRRLMKREKELKKCTYYVVSKK